MTVDVLDPADPDPAVGDAVGVEDMVDLKGAVLAGPLGDEPVLGESPPERPSGQRISRGGSPAGEPATVVGDPAVDQVVFDAEFVAMVLAEAPWAGPGPAPVPPQAATGTRRAPPPRSPSEFPARAARTRTKVDPGLRAPRRGCCGRPVDDPVPGHGLLRGTAPRPWPLTAF